MKDKAMAILNFKTTKAEVILISKIAERAVKMASDMNVDYEMLTVDMDLTACHVNGNPLDLQRLMDADDFNFAHDVFGIRRHINRATGQLEDCFVPRCSKPTLAETGSAS